MISSRFFHCIEDHKIVEEKGKKISFDYASHLAGAQRFPIMVNKYAESSISCDDLTKWK